MTFSYKGIKHPIELLHMRDYLIVYKSLNRGLSFP